MCNAEWDDNFLPVRKDGVLRWFDSGEVRDTFPMKANVNNLTELLWKKESYTNGIFNLAVSTVNKYNVEAFFLQLIGLKFIALEKRKDGILYWVIGRERTNEFMQTPLYKLDCNWKGINIFASDTKFRYAIKY
jgi:hypothetical protein